MKEYWVNEYEVDGERVFGAKHETREMAIIQRCIYDNLVGRWHVKLK